MGPDSLHPHLLKEVACEISLPLSIIFNKSLISGSIPDDWRLANITAIFKKGDRNNPENYRPISLTCILCKVLESIIKDHIMIYLERNDMLSQCQHGFRYQRSCVTQLLEVMEDFTNYIDNKNTIDVIYLDFKKAFDSVPHRRLFVKLEAYGITGRILGWIKAFLSNRMQRVVVNNEVSELKLVISGVPQGSVLGPLLFILFINDLPDNLNSICKIFADDTKIYSDTSNSALLQNDLYKLFKWSSDWQLNFNISKCKVMHVGRNNPSLTYFVDTQRSNVLSVVASEKDLGVIFDKNLYFDEHIYTTVNKANKLIGIIYRSFSYLNVTMLITLYKTLIRPILEYGNCIWSPLFKRQSIILEKVQRRATRLLMELQGLSYADRLLFLKLPTLKYRRTRGDLIQLYKIVHGLDNVDYNSFFRYSQIDFTRGDRYKIYVSGTSTSLRHNYFVSRTVSIWNKLKFETKDSKTINSFKKSIDRELHDQMYIFDE